MIGYASRTAHGRRRYPVYAPKSMVFPELLAVLTIVPRLTPWQNPGMALLSPEGHDVYLLSSNDRHDPEYEHILTRAATWAQEYRLLVWDAPAWRADLLAFNEGKEAQGRLREVGVHCLRTSLEEQGMDAGTLTEACQLLHLPVPASEVLAQSYAIRACWEALGSLNHRALRV